MYQVILWLDGDKHTVSITIDETQPIPNDALLIAVAFQLLIPRDLYRFSDAGNSRHWVLLDDKVIGTVDIVRS